MNINLIVAIWDINHLHQTLVQSGFRIDGISKADNEIIIFCADDTPLSVQQDIRAATLTYAGQPPPPPPATPVEAVAVGDIDLAFDLAQEQIIAQAEKIAQLEAALNALQSVGG